MRYHCFVICVLVALLAIQNPPSIYTDKAVDTPHLYQQDPNGQYEGGGRNFCAPTAAADGMVYLSRHGYPALCPGKTMDDAYALVRTLASKTYIGTDELVGTDDTQFITGVASFVQQHNIRIKAFDYEGFRPLYGPLRGRDWDHKVSIDWVKQKIAQPNTFVWLHLGYYSKTADHTYNRYFGHFVAAVGYGTDGQSADLYAFIIRNPALPKRETASSDPQARLATDSVELRPCEPAMLTGKYGGLPRRSDDLYVISGAAIRTPKQAAFVLVDGALALELGPPN